MYRFSKEEIELLLKNLVIMCDTREQKNEHITDYFKKHKIDNRSMKLDSGDYSCYIRSNDSTKKLIGERNYYFDSLVCIERKNSVDELSQSIKDRVRFEYEFMRLINNNTKTMILVEDAVGYVNILKGEYKSDYQPKAFLGSLIAFEARYNFSTIFLDKTYSGNFIYFTLYYHAREYLKSL